MNKVFLWGYWARNFGDDLFLNVYNKKMSPYKLKTYILTAKKNKAYYKMMGFRTICSDSLLYKITYKFLITLGSPELYYKLVNKNSLFVMLGGSLFSENKGELAEKRQLKNLSYSVNSAKKAFVIGSNFGPYNSTWFYDEYKSLFCKTYDVCFRDKKSYELFSSKLSNVRIAPDIAFEAGFEMTKKTVDEIVISIIDLETRKDLSKYREVYENAIFEIACYHLNCGESVKLLSLCDTEGDLIACNRVYKRIKTKHKNNIEIINYENIDDIVRAISEAKKVYATRFHALMVSLCFHKNVVPIIYNEKVLNAINTYCNSLKSFMITDLKETTINIILNTNQIPVLKLFESSQFEQLIHYCEQIGEIKK